MKRYSPVSGIGNEKMRESTVGDFVKYEDYVALQQELAESLQAEELATSLAREAGRPNLKLILQAGQAIEIAHKQSQGYASLMLALDSWVREWELWEGSDGEGSRMNLEVAEMRLEIASRPFVNPDRDILVSREVQQRVLDVIDEKKGD